MLVIVFMLVFVIPTFTQMFKEMGAELPLPTRIVIGLSDFVRGYFWLIGLAFGGGRVRPPALLPDGERPVHHRRPDPQGAGVRRDLPQGGRRALHADARHARRVGRARSSRRLRITASTAGNKVVEKAVLQCRTSVTEGKTLAEPLKISGVFPTMVTQMVSVGEQTGALDAMLSKIADFYDDEVDTAVSTLTSLLEPIMIVFLGVIVGGLVVAMYLPIFKLVTLIK